MRSLLTIITLLIYNLASFGQALPNYNKAIIWRGFHHQWSYNHRVNCLGDYVKRFDQLHHQDPTSTHISATGAGPDNTNYDSYYTMIETPSAVFQESKAAFSLKGHFDSLHQDIDTFSFNIGKWMSGRSHYVTLLNGFDMHTEEASDRIREFKLYVKDLSYDPAKNIATIIVKADMKLDCQGPGCKGSKILAYDFDVYILMMAYNDGEAWVGQDSFSKKYKWTVYKELDNEIVTRPVASNQHTDLPFATIGIKSFGVKLNKGLDMIQWNNYLQQPNITSFGPGSRHIEAALNFQFRQWNKGMMSSKAEPWQHIFSQKQAGSESASIDVVTIQFKSVDSLSYQQTHQDPVMFWPGGNIKSYDPKENKYDIRAIQTYNIRTQKMEVLK